MIPLKMPKWVDSIRSWIALLCVATLCIAVFLPEGHINEKELVVLEKITMLVITFYYVVKDRKH